jgi:hypothetical protein
MKIHTKNVYNVGDFNNRTATDDDFIFIDDDDPSTEGIDIVNSVCFLDMHSLPRKRNSRDKTRNNFGKLLLDFCKSNDFFMSSSSINIKSSSVEVLLLKSPSRQTHS